MSPKDASTFVSYILDVLRLEMNSSYLQKKMDDHRSYTALIFIGLIPLGLADYLIEWGVSDQKSKIHFGYYAFYFWLAIPAYALWMHVSAESEHSFRSNPITHFGLIRSPVSVLSDHF